MSAICTTLEGDCEHADGLPNLGDSIEHAGGDAAAPATARAAHVGLELMAAVFEAHPPARAEVFTLLQARRPIEMCACDYISQPYSIHAAVGSFFLQGKVRSKAR